MSLLPDGFAYWIMQSSIVANSWLYVSGGEIWARWNNQSTPSPFYNEQTYAFDLTTPWTTAAVTAIKTNISAEQTASRIAQMWYDPHAEPPTVYSFGGQFYSTTGNVFNFNVPVSLWGFEPVQNGSAQYSLKAQGNGALLQANIQGASCANSAAAHYAFGGCTLLSNDPGDCLATPSLVTATYTDAVEDWTNTTVMTPASLYSTSGQAQFVPTFGAEGVLIMFGGNAPASALDTAISLKSMNAITVYDIRSKTYYTQTATGDTPLSRVDFCSVGAGASDNSTYEIYVYGGTQGPEPNSDDMLELSRLYVLLLPAFIWVEVPDSTATWRSRHTCQIIGNRQMISVGGFQDNGALIATPQNDPWTNGLGIFDLVALNWTMQFDPDAAPYAPADALKAVYAGNPRTPTFDQDGLGAIFAANASQAASIGLNGSTSTSINGTSRILPPSNTTRLYSSVSIGAIVGGVIAGVVLITLVLGATWFCRRRKRKDRDTVRPTYFPEMDASKQVKRPHVVHELHPESVGNVYHELSPESYHRVPHEVPGS